MLYVLYLGKLVLLLTLEVLYLFGMMKNYLVKKLYSSFYELRDNILLIPDRYMFDMLVAGGGGEERS